jgi:hypothetical protein
VTADTHGPPGAGGHHPPGHPDDLRIYFEPTSLFNTLTMLVLLAGGLGLVARSLKPYA